MKNNYKNNNRFMEIISIISLLVFVFIPTSHLGIIYGVTHTICVWAISTILVIIVGRINKVDYSNLIIEQILVNLYMLIVTLIAQYKYDDYHVSLARIAPLIVLIYASHIKIIKIPSFTLMKKLLHFFCIVCIVINVSILLNNTPVIKFICNNYNQYFDLALHYSILVGHKPVMTFGVHTYAAYFYFIFFILCYYTYERTKENIFLLYSLFLCIFCFFLVSTTAIIFFCMMILFYIYKLSKKMNTKNLILLSVILISILCVVIFNYSDISKRLLKNFTGGENSFISRYSEQSVFLTNFEIITTSLGIGYNVIENMNVGYSDSGYVVYLTMGSIPLMIYVYYRIYQMLKMNIMEPYKKILIAIIFAFEVALPASFNYRFIFMLYFVVCYLNALSSSMKGENISEFE